MLRQTSLHELVNFKIPAYAVGPAGKLTVPYLIRLLQESAMRNTVRLEISSPELVAAYGLSWVLRQQRITCQRWPVMGEDVSILTAPAGFSRGLLTYRDFHVLGGTDKPIISAVSEWLLMDVNTRRPRPIPPDILALQSDLAPAAAHLEKPTGKLLPPKNITGRAEVKVSYGMLDFNRHLTNPVFAELMLEPLGLEWLELNKLTEVAISFQAEARYGDVLTAASGPGENCGIAHSLYRGEELLATMETNWSSAESA